MDGTRVSWSLDRDELWAPENHCLISPGRRAHANRLCDGQRKKRAAPARIELLRPDYRAVILMRYREGARFEEIAPRMDRSVDAVRNLSLRGIKRLQQLIE